MSRTISPAPVRKSVRVAASPTRAFEVFTAGVGLWWPETHHIGRAEYDTHVIEPRVGGRWYERGVDGSECDIGHVLAWDPPTRLVLAWQLNAEWKYNPDLVTEVEVLFTPDGEGGTRVALEHRKLERLGDAAVDLREKIDAPGGWSALLQLFAQSASNEERLK